MHVLPKEEWSDYASHLPSLEKRITCDIPNLTCIDCATLEANKPLKNVDHAEQSVAFKNSDKCFKTLFCSLTPMSATKIAVRSSNFQKHRVMWFCNRAWSKRKI